MEKCWIAAEENVNCIDTTGAGDSFAAGISECTVGWKRCEKMCERGKPLWRRGGSAYRSDCMAEWWTLRIEMNK